ncbi:uncharacterized protein LOC143186685 [Calliopsis andreniformis]|uniref:uncharacterized protein LOC143186685 n=1 Tax=Calliopsis andreniformis TaxID=337506 RepID=UPI003FCDE587
MVRQFSFAIVITLINVACSNGDNLWCYDCNTNLKDRHTTGCNDPYVPSPSFDLVSCSKNGSHHCLKSVITHRDVLITVRGCVPSHEIDGYCQHQKQFPESIIMCSFCNNYACNGQESFRSRTYRYKVNPMVDMLPELAATLLCICLGYLTNELNREQLTTIKRPTDVETCCNRSINTSDGFKLMGWSHTSNFSTEDCIFPCFSR